MRMSGRTLAGMSNAKVASEQIHAMVRQARAIALHLDLQLIACESIRTVSLALVPT